MGKPFCLTVGFDAPHSHDYARRIGVNLDYQTRRSDRSTRNYEGLRFGTSVTYGF